MPNHELPFFMEPIVVNAMVKGLSHVFFNSPKYKSEISIDLVNSLFSSSLSSRFVFI